MYRNQRKLTEKLLFDYYLISSIREDEVFSPFPFYMDKNAFNHMVKATETLDKLVRRLILKFTENQEPMPFNMGEFPMMEEILALSAPLLPFFWVRYDAFQRAEGGIFFSEFNYDKPCAQRETLVSEMLAPQGSPNGQFAQKFAEGFRACWEAFNKNQDKTRPTVAILIAPNHSEELHLAHLYMDMLSTLDYEFVIATWQNFEVLGDKVTVFGKEADIILRQYPVEHLYEIQDFPEILRLHEAGKVLLLNDPRAIIGQVKSLFAYLWEMVQKKDAFLTEEEVQTIRETIPYTAVFEPHMAEMLQRDKDKYVIKAVYGRYSEEVYIGAMMNGSEWAEILRYVTESGRTHIIQAFCPIRKEKQLRLKAGRFEETEAFGNFGIYLTNGEFSGICARWSSDYLTGDDTVWMTSVGVREKSLKVLSANRSDRQKLWNEINDTMAFQWGYTGGYTNYFESFSLDSLIFDKKDVEEIQTATEGLIPIFKKTAALVQEQIELFSALMGMDEKTARLAAKQLTDQACFIGRMDWVYDTLGRLKLLEFNSETPGGIIEAAVLNELIMEKLNLRALGLQNPNGGMGDKIVESFQNIIKDYEKNVPIKNIAFVSSTFYEDWYNTTTLYEHVKKLPYNFMLGETCGLEARGDKLYLYGEPLDALYRHHPLDWFEKESRYAGVIEALENKTLSINPPPTLITQSKAFFALIWELCRQGFYEEAETALIQTYIPQTTLSPKKPGTKDYCIKPLFGREGEAVRFSFERDLTAEDVEECIFQQRVEIQSVSLDVYTTLSHEKDTLYPIVGAFVTGDKYAGLFTRMGGRVTDKWVIFVPSFMAEEQGTIPEKKY